MAWTDCEWACGHTGSIQLYGKTSSRDYKVANEAGRKCMACWLVDRWQEESDPRAKREDRYILAGKIAEGKGIRIYDLPEISEISNPTIPAEKERVLSLLEALIITPNEKIDVEVHNNTIREISKSLKKM